MTTAPQPQRRPEMTNARKRRPETEIINAIIASPLGFQMTHKWGWKRSDFAACLSYAVQLESAIRADRRPNGPRANRLREEFRRSFGATKQDLEALIYVDRNWEKEGLAASRGVSEAVKDAEYVAMILLTEMPDRPPQIRPHLNRNPEGE